MRNRFSSLMLIFSIYACNTFAHIQVSGSELEKKIDEYIAAQMKVNFFSGSILIAKDGNVLLSKGYGLANRELGIANAPHTKFRLASITKQFTAAAILLLEEAGKLSTENSICKHVSPCPAIWEPITIHHLLTHTSGIPNYTRHPNYKDSKSHNKTKEQMVSSFRDLPLDFPVDERFQYNNSGYFLLGMIIEKASGTTYADFLSANIFAPLGLENTGYDVSATILSHRASGYSRRRDHIVNAAYLDMDQPYAAGSLYSTVEDLYKWDRALEGRKLLSAKSYEKMWTPFKNNYAYGWAVFSGKHRLLGHNGRIDGFSTDFSRYPDDNTCVIVLSNLDSGSHATPISRDVAAILFGIPYEIPR